MSYKKSAPKNFCDIKTTCVLKIIYLKLILKIICKNNYLYSLVDVKNFIILNGFLIKLEFTINFWTFFKSSWIYTATVNVNY